MNPTTLLLRQVHPTHIKADGTVASPAFWPFPKDKNLLSVDDGDMTTPEAAWKYFTDDPKCSSCGVWAVVVEEVTQAELTCRPDPVKADPEKGVRENPAHAVVDFSAYAEKQQKAKSKVLSARANSRGAVYLPQAGA